MLGLATRKNRLSRRRSFYPEVRHGGFSRPYDEAQEVLERLRFWKVRVVTCDGYDSIRDERDNIMMAIRQGITTPSTKAALEAAELALT